MITWAFLIGLGFLGAGAAILFFWNRIVFVFQNHVIPWLRKKIGDKVADFVASIFSFIDGGVVLTRNTIKKGWRWLKSVRTRSTYKKRNPDLIDVEHLVATTNGGIQVTVKEISFDEIPSSIRGEMIRSSKNEITVDDADIIKGKYKKRVSDYANRNPILKREIQSDPELRDLLDDGASLAN